MAFVGGGVIGGIKADPAEMGQVCLNPGMGGFAGSSLMAAARLVEIATDVAAWYFEQARQGYHDMRIILADTFAHAQRFINGRVNARGVGRVFKSAVDSAVQISQNSQRVVAPSYIQFACQFFE